MTLKGSQKAAVLLVQMGKDRSAKVLSHMRESEVEEVMAEVARISDIDGDTVIDTMNEFRTLMDANAFYAQGGLDFAREVLEEGLGTQKAQEILDRLLAMRMKTPFEFLRRADPRQVLSYLQDEHPQTIAVVLAHIHPELAAPVLSGLPDGSRADVAVRIATMEQTVPEVIDQIEEILERKLKSVIQTAEATQAGGVQPLVDILNRADRATERIIFDDLERQDRDLAEEVRSRMFVFEDIVGLEDRSVQIILRDVDQKDLATALKGVGDNVKDKIVRNLSERVRDNLDEEISMLGPVRLKAVEESQGKVVRVIRKLEEEGKIVISRGGDDFVV